MWKSLNQKMKIQSLSALCACRWKVRWSFVVHKTFLELHNKTATQNSADAESGLQSDVTLILKPAITDHLEFNITQRKQHKVPGSIGIFLGSTPSRSRLVLPTSFVEICIFCVILLTNQPWNVSIQLVSSNPNLQNPRDPKRTWWDFIYTLFNDKTFTVAAELTTLAHSISGRCTSSARVNGIKNTFPNQVGISGILKTSISPDFIQIIYTDHTKTTDCVSMTVWWRTSLDPEQTPLTF